MEQMTRVASFARPFCFSSPSDQPKWPPKPDVRARRRNDNGWWLYFGTRRNPTERFPHRLERRKIWRNVAIARNGQNSDGRILREGSERGYYTGKTAYKCGIMFVHVLLENVQEIRLTRLVIKVPFSPAVGETVYELRLIDTSLISDKWAGS